MKLRFVSHQHRLWEASHFHSLHKVQQVKHFTKGKGESWSWTSKKRTIFLALIANSTQLNWLSKHQVLIPASVFQASFAPSVFCTDVGAVTQSSSISMKFSKVYFHHAVCPKIETNNAGVLAPCELFPKDLWTDSWNLQAH